MLKHALWYSPKSLLAQRLKHQQFLKDDEANYAGAQHGRVGVGLTYCAAQLSK